MFDFWIAAVLIWLVVSAIGYLFWRFLGWLFGLATRHNCEHCGRQLTRNWSCTACVTPKLVAASAPTPSLAPVPVPAPADRSLKSDLQSAQRLMEYGKHLGAWDDKRITFIRDSLALLSPDVSVAKQPASKPPAAKQADAKEPVAKISDFGGARSPLELPHAKRVELQPVGAKDKPLQLQRTSEERPQTPVVHPLDVSDEELTKDKKRSVGRETIQNVQKSARQWTGEMIVAFMEKSNIRWMELIAASLIVFCSVGLVISLWSTLTATSRFFPSIVFMLATLAVHGAGQYTLKKWKLQNTSRGILHIALMLIPLSVMIGIRLARGESVTGGGAGVPVDWQYWAMLLLGMGVYGGLAITASQSLFIRSWIPVAVSTIVSSLSLVLIGWGHRQSISELNQAWTLVPALGTVSVMAWFASYYGAVRVRRTFGFYRRHIGIAIQLLFASLAVIVFWNMHFGSVLKAGPWVWMVLGSFATAWTIWGLIHSDLSKVLISNSKSDSDSASNSDVLQQAANAQVGSRREEVGSRGEETSSAVILSWLIGMVAAVAVLWATWGLAEHRWPLLAFLAIVGVWQGSLGIATRNVQAIAGGCVAMILATTLGLEAVMMPTPKLVWSDWFSWQRVVSLAALGGLALFASKKFDDSEQVAVGKGTRIAGALALGGGLILSVLATLVPWGRTPYGGDWGAALVTLYGLVGIGLGLIHDTRRGSERREWLNEWIVGSQLLCLLGVHRMFSQATWLPEYFVQFRPLLSTIMGFGLLALVWVAIGLVCRRRSVRLSISQGTSLVFGGAIMLATLSWIASVFSISPVGYFLAMGWILPVVLLCRWICSIIGDSEKPEAQDRNDLGLGFREIGLALIPIWLTVCVHRFIESTLSIDSMTNLAQIPMHLGILMLFAGLISFGFDRVWQVSNKQEWLRPVGYSAGHWWSDFSTLIMTTLTISVAIGSLSLSMGWGIPKTSMTERINSIGQADAWYLGFGLGAIGILTALGWLVSKTEGENSRRWLWKLSIWLVAFLVGTQGTLVWGPSISGAVTGGRTVSGGPAGLHPWVVTTWLLTLVAAGFAWLDWLGVKQGNLRNRVPKEGDDFDVRYMGRGALESLHLLPLGSVLILTVVAVLVFLAGTTASVHPMPWSAAWSSASFGTRSAMVARWFLPIGLATFAGWLVAVVPRLTGGNLAGSLSGTLSLGADDANHSNAENAGGLSNERTSIFARGILLALSIALVLVAIPTTLGSSLVEWWTSILSAFSIGFGMVSFGTSWEWFYKLSHGRNRESSGLRLLSARAASEWLGQLAIVSGFGVALFACADNIQHAAGVKLMPSITNYQTILGIFVAAASYLVSGVQRERDKGVLWMVFIAVIAPVLPLVISSFLLSGWSVGSVPKVSFRAEPMHAMILGWIVALGIGVEARRRDRSGFTGGNESVIWGGLATLSMVLSLWHPSGTPTGWILGLGIAIAALVLARGLVLSNPWFGHVAGICSAAVISCYLLNRNGRFIAGHQELMLWGPLVCGWVSLAWHLMQPAKDSLRGGWSVDQTVSIHVPIALMLWTGLGVAAFSVISVITSVLRIQITSSSVSWSTVLLGFGSLGLAILRCWDVRSAMRGWSVYLSAVSVSMSLGATLAGSMQLTSVHTFLACVYGGLIAMVVLAAFLREWLRESTQLIPALKLGSLAPNLDDFVAAGKWLSGLHSGFGLVILGLAPLIVLSGYDVVTARAASLLPILSVLSILPIATDQKYRVPRLISLALITLAFVLLSWSDLIMLQATSGAESLAWWRGHYTLGLAQRTFLAIVAMSLGYRWISSRFRDWLDWEYLLERAGSLLMVLGTLFGWGYLAGLWGAVQGFGSSDGVMRIAETPWTIGVGTFVAWTLLAWSWLRAMFSRDSGVVSKHVYLIAAELCIIASLLVLRLHFPWIFAGWIKQWWPIIVYGLAFGSIAVGEWLRRSGRESVADPIERQSILLPIIPILATLIPQWKVAGSFWSTSMSFSLLLLISGVAYLVIGSYRRMTLLKSFAMLLFLGAFWSLLHSQENLKLIDHPQLWLIPPALASLIFVERNRDQLATSVVTGMRYIGLLVIYMSSSVEMIFKSFELQFWAPVVLMALAVAGILLGVGLRIRAFLYCGSWFVFVALFGMVWQAQQAIGQVWPWWVFGIFMGVCLIALIGYFEKNRARLLKVVDSLKEWQP